MFKYDHSKNDRMDFDRYGVQFYNFQSQENSYLNSVLALLFNLNSKLTFELWNQMKEQNIK